MIVELRFYRLCAVVCGRNAAFWGCEGRERQVVDDMIAWVHNACLNQGIPCVYGTPFWNDLLPMRRVSTKGKVDGWHHADQSSGKMAYVFDRFATHLISLLQLTRVRDENCDLIRNLLGTPFGAPLDSLKRSAPIQLGVGVPASPPAVVGVTPFSPEQPGDPNAAASAAALDSPDVAFDAMDEDDDAIPWGLFDVSNMYANVGEEQPLTAPDIEEVEVKRSQMNTPRGATPQVDVPLVAPVCRNCFGSEFSLGQS